MGDRAIAGGALLSAPGMIAIVTTAILNHIGMSDVVCGVVGMIIAVPGTIITYALLMRDLRKQDGEKWVTRQKIAS